MPPEESPQTQIPLTTPSLNGNSTQPSDGWREHIPADLKGEKFWENVKDLPSLVKGYAEGIKYQGQSVRIPGSDAKPEDWARFYDKLRPKDAKEYTLDHSNAKIDNYNQQLEDSARAKFHELGLSNQQAKGLYDWFLQSNVQALEAHGQRYSQSQADLTKEWGAQSERNFKIAQQGLGQLVDNNPEHPLVKWLDSTGETYNPVLIKFFYEIGNALGEDGATGIEEQHVATKDELKSWQDEINLARSDPKSPFMDVNHGGHKAAVDHVLDLYKRIEEANGDNG